MPLFSYKDLPKILEQAEKGHPAPVYLIAGDSYLSNDVHEQLIDRLIPTEQRSFNLEIADGEKEDIRYILERLQTFPFFPGRKVVSVKNPVQIFSVGNEDRLFKRAEDAWQKGQIERSTRLLRSLFRNAGSSLDSNGSGLGGEEEVLFKKFFQGKEGAIPNWCQEALVHIRTQLPSESETLNPEDLLESALRQGLPKDHILIFLMSDPPGSKKIIKSIAEYGVVINLALKQSKRGEQTATLKGFLKTRLSQEGKTILPQAEALLMDRIGPEAALLEMEFQKLLAYTGERKQILPNDVTEIVGAYREEPLYELTTVLGEGNLLKALIILNKLWEQGFNPLQILAGITTAIRRLLVARDLLGAISGVSARSWQDFGSFSAKILPRLKQAPLPEPFSKIHPFVLFNTLKTSQNYSRPSLVRALEVLHEADRLLKTSGVTPTFLIEDFIISFCNKI